MIWSTSEGLVHHYNRKQHEPQTRIWSDWHKRVRVSGELDHVSFNESQYQYWPSRRPYRTQVCSAVSLKLEECYPLMQESSWTSYNHLWGQTTQWHQSNKKVCANHIMFIAKKRRGSSVKKYGSLQRPFLVELIRLSDGKVCVFIRKHLFSESVCGSVFTSSREEEDDVLAAEIVGLSLLELGITSGFWEECVSVEKKQHWKKWSILNV